MSWMARSHIVKAPEMSGIKTRGEKIMSMEGKRSHAERAAEQKEHSSVILFDLSPTRRPEGHPRQERRMRGRGDRRGGGRVKKIGCGGARSIRAQWPR